MIYFEAYRVGILGGHPTEATAIRVALKDGKPKGKPT
jgi:hypothetical protein